MKVLPVDEPRSPAYTLAKGVLSLIGGVIGYNLAIFLLGRELLSAPINLFYLTLLGVLVFYLFSTPLARRWERLWTTMTQRAARIPPQAILAAGVGVTVALVITVLLNTLLEAVPGFTWYWSLLITLVLVSASSWFFVKNRGQFAVFSPFGPRGLPPTSEPSPRLKLVDTSAIIDGRIAEIIEANFIDGELLIPRFILNELQNIADSSDPLRRNRGRRGLEMLDRLVSQGHVPVNVIDDDISDIGEADEKLVRLCQSKGAALITTDYNLNRVAALQNIRVLNVHQLANVMRAMFLPGERLSLTIVKEGREAGQGLAYLDDGTMVVVEDAQNLTGQSVDVVVTSNLQTNMGRMIFARLQ